MNLEEFEKIDQVMTVLWKNKRSVYDIDDIAEITGLTADEVENALDLPLADFYVENAYKSEDTNTPYQITDKGYSFFSKTNYVNEHVKSKTGSTGNYTINNFSNINGSTIYNLSSFNNAFNKIKKSDPNIANALEQLKAIVETSKNPEAIELFDSINEEIVKEQPKKTVLKSIWNGLLNILPHIKTAGEIYGQLHGYLG